MADPPRETTARLLILLYGLAGMTALAYEVLWSRMLTVLLGTSNVAIAITVSTFMLGLGLGSLWATGRTSRLSTPRLLARLSTLEAIVAGYALSLPVLLGLGFQTLSRAVSEPGALLHLLGALSLLLPALLLGAAFPFAIAAGRRLGAPLHALYGGNALGGVFGALLPLLLLPSWGWTHALQMVALLGGLLALALGVLARRSPASTPANPSEAPTRTPPPASLLNYALIGAGAMMLEIVWIRMYGMILLRTEYVMAMVLAIFLAGIALGSLLSSRLPLRASLRWAPWLVMGSGALGLVLLPETSSLLQQWPASSLPEMLGEQALVLLLFTLPPTLVLGAWLPLLSLETRATHAHGNAAWLYGVNSMGAFVGGILGCFVLIPFLGSTASWVFALLLLALAGCHWGGASRWRASVLLAFGVGLWFWKGSFPPVSSLLPQSFAEARVLRLHEDAMSITHVVEQPDGQRILLADLQRLDASTEPTAVAVQRNEARLPMLLHPKPRNILFLGLGTGITAGAARAWPDVEITAVELSAGAIAAATHDFSRSNHEVVRHANIVHDDARRFLMRKGSMRYDVIVGDLFHPDLVGRGQLLSLQQFQRARAHLRRGGLFCQWLALNQFDIASLRIVLRTFAHAFPRNALFIDGFRLAMVGYADAPSDAPTLLAALRKHAPETQKRMLGGEGFWTWMGRYWGTAQMLGGATGTIQDEWWPRIEYRLPRRRYQSEALGYLLAWLRKRHASWEHTKQALGVHNAKQRASLRASWMSNQILMHAQLQQIAPSLREPEAIRLFHLAYRNDPHNRWAAFAVADAMYESLRHGPPPGLDMAQALQRILEIRPDHEQALRQWCQMQDEGEARARCQRRLARINPYRHALSTRRD